MRTSVLAIPLAIAGTLVACVSTKAVLTGPPKYPAVAPDQVRVFRSEADAPKPFEEVAIIYSEGDYSWTDEASLVASIKKKAGAVGANGVILGDHKEPTTGQKVWNALLWTKANEKMKALAIRIPITTEAPPVQR